MGAEKTERAAGGRGEALAAFREERASATRSWGNGPGDVYGWHAHEHHKVLFCLEGSITFHLRDAEVVLGLGDRLDLEPGTEHAATVGPNGCRCVEAFR
jgi:quercetin dioxygenase-like cupin family protein